MRSPQLLRPEPGASPWKPAAFAEMRPVSSKPSAPSAPPHPAPEGPEGGSLPASPCRSGAEMLQLKRWVVVGKGSNGTVLQILSLLRAKGREVVHVDPSGSSGAGVPKRLVDLALTGDVVDLCVRAELGAEVIQDCKKLGVNNVFIQPGAGSPALEAACAEAGISVHNGCVLREMP